MKHKTIGIRLLSLIVTLLLTVVLTITVWQINHVHSHIEVKAQRIVDVAMPMVFESSRIVRILDRLATEGDSILWIDSIPQRRAKRLTLSNIEADAAVQGDERMRSLIKESFIVLDQSIEALDKNGLSNRDAVLKQWQPIKRALLSESEAVVAKVSTIASDEAEAILETANNTQRLVLLACGICIIASLIVGLSLYIGFIIPILRLSKAIKDVETKEIFTLRPAYINEIQILNNAALELAQAHHQMKLAKIQLESMANTDVLTGLANRRMFELNGTAEFERSHRSGGADSFALVMFDIDHFKRINDKYGHPGGDLVLKALGSYLKASNRMSDLPTARIGGEEFVLSLTNASLESARLAAERIRTGIEKLTVSMPNHELLNFTASFGVAVCTPKDTCLNDILDRADKALYLAKNNGRNQVCLDSIDAP